MHGCLPVSLALANRAAPAVPQLEHALPPTSPAAAAAAAAAAAPCLLLPAAPPVVAPALLGSGRSSRLKHPAHSVSSAGGKLGRHRKGRTAQPGSGCPQQCSWLAASNHSSEQRLQSCPPTGAACCRRACLWRGGCTRPLTAASCSGHIRSPHPHPPLPLLPTPRSLSPLRSGEGGAGVGRWAD